MASLKPIKGAGCDLHLGGRDDPGSAQTRRRGIDQIRDQTIDHAAHDLVHQAAAGEPRIPVADLRVVLEEQRHLEQLLHADEPGADAVVHVVIVVGDLIGEIGELRLQPGLLAADEALAELAESQRVVVRAMLQYALAAFEA